jgi:hypothetical protein
MRGGVECGRRVTSTESSGMGGGAVGRRGGGTAVYGPEDEAVADCEEPSRYDRCQVSSGIKRRARMGATHQI